MGPFGFRPPQHFQQQPMYQQPQSSGIGGIIKKILGKSDSQNIQGGYYPQFNQGYPFANQWYQTLPQNMIEQTTSSGSSGLLNTLNTVQKGLGMMQQVTPYIKEFSPMLKNLPLLFDMMKMMMDSDSSEETEENNEIKESNLNEEEEVKKEEPKSTTEKDEEQLKSNKMNHIKRKNQSKKTNELPKPKLYI